MVEPAQEWKLKLFGDFELIAPSGTPVRLLYRSAQALLAILAIHRRQGVSREELGRILWPGSSLAKRQENLRQALAAVKAVIGPRFVEASRSHCRLSDAFCVVTDYDDPSLRGSGAFMPGFEGQWFDQVGRRAQTTPPGRILDSFLHLLLWMADHDPGKMVGLMRDNHGLTFGLNCSDREYLLGRAPEDPSLAGWKKFFEAGLHGATGADLGSVTLQHGRVVSEAEANHDIHLAVQASSQVSLYHAWQNNLSQAISTSDWCLATATTSSDKSIWATATQMKGNILVHSGKVWEGLELLERAEQMYRDPIDCAIMRALRCNYLSELGKYDDALELLDPRLRPVLGTGHAFLNIVWELASASATSRDKPPHETLDELEKVVSAARRYGDTSITTTALESLAKACMRVGETGLATAHMSQARRIRRKHSRHYTPWDRIRLAS